MANRLVFSFLLLALMSSDAQVIKGRVRMKSGVTKPECSSQALCFTGEVKYGQEFRKTLNEDLDFVVELPGGIEIALRHADTSCIFGIWVANPPFRAHHLTEIDALYDWTAELEVATSPREFLFPTNCEEYNKLFNLSQSDAGIYIDQLPILARGSGRLWITDSKVKRSRKGANPNNGSVDWLRFSVEIKLPFEKPTR